MTRAIDWTGWFLNATLVVCVFVGGTCIYAPELIASPSPMPIAEVVKRTQGKLVLQDDGTLPAMTEAQLAQFDAALFPDGGSK
jgi:hypothetical protein